MGGITVDFVSESSEIESGSKRTREMFDSTGGGWTDSIVLGWQVLDISAVMTAPDVVLWRRPRGPFKIGETDITADRLVVGAVNEVKTFTGSPLGVKAESDLSSSPIFEKVKLTEFALSSSRADAFE